MNKPSLIIYSLFISLNISSCATNPGFNLHNIDQQFLPSHANTKTHFMGKTILWGGTIIETKNQTNATVIEVLAYPLNRFYRPQLEQDTLGRFLIRHKGYLEATHYTPGRLVTVKGVIREIQTGKIGNSSYQFPVVEDEQLHLWKKQQSSSSGSFHFGIGISL